MSANFWGGLLLRTQARACVDVVSRELEGFFDEVEYAYFEALKGTKLTWVFFAPLDFDDLDTLIEEGPTLAKKLARALKTQVWLVANSDYSGREFRSFDANGKRRWSALDDGEESSKRSPQERLEEEAGLDWDACIDAEGEAKRTTWSKKVRLAKPGRKEKKPAKAGLSVADVLPPPPDPLAAWRRSVLLQRLSFAHDASREMVLFAVAPSALQKLEELAIARELIPDRVIEAAWTGAPLQVSAARAAGEPAELPLSLPRAVGDAMRETAQQSKVSLNDVMSALIERL